MRYEGVVYRPPSEARSLIFQVTIGCAHNQCTFCTMYKDKQFRIRNLVDIYADIDEMSALYRDYEIKVFLADGDAWILPTEMLLQIIARIKNRFPYVQRITSYATAKDILRKSDNELKQLYDAGLQMVYVGAESGDEEILKAIRKDVTCEELILAAQRLKKCGIALSLTLISGLGGKERLKSHAVESARLVSAMKPDYLGFLTLMLDDEAPIMKEIREGRLTLLEPDDVVEEMNLFLNHVDSEGTVFRSNHASNYIMLKGTLNKDIPLMKKELQQATEHRYYRSERSRRL